MGRTAIPKGRDRRPTDRKEALKFLVEVDGEVKKVWRLLPPVDCEGPVEILCVDRDEQPFRARVWRDGDYEREVGW